MILRFFFSLSVIFQCHHYSAGQCECLQVRCLFVILCLSSRQRRERIKILINDPDHNNNKISRLIWDPSCYICISASSQSMMSLMYQLFPMVSHSLTPSILLLEKLKGQISLFETTPNKVAARILGGSLAPLRQPACRLDAKERRLRSRHTVPFPEEASRRPK